MDKTGTICRGDAVFFKVGNNGGRHRLVESTSRLSQGPARAGGAVPAPTLPPALRFLDKQLAPAARADFTLNDFARVQRLEV